MSHPTPAESTPAHPPAANRLKETALSDRPQERLLRHGPAALSDTELLAMLLRSGTRGHDVLTLSSRLISEAGSLAGLIAWRENDFRRMKGIGRVKALQLLAVMELARRVLTQQAGEAPLLNAPALAVAYLQSVSTGLSVEKVWLLTLNVRHRLIKLHEITSGTATQSLLHPREVFREAIRDNAVAFLIAHNHPSGDPAPSAADIKITRQLREASATLGIELLDHLILGQLPQDPCKRGYYSFRESGLL